MAFLDLINHIIDYLVIPFANTSAVTDLWIVSFISAVLLLAFFKKISNQEKIKFHKNKIFGNFLEIALYRDQFSRTILSQLSILKHNVLYMRFFISPLLLLSIPMLIVCMQLEFRLGTKPLKEGDSFIVSVQLEEPFPKNNATNKNLSIETSKGITLETKPIFDKNSGNFYWRAKLSQATENDFFTFKMSDDSTSITKKIATTNTHLKRFSQETTKVSSISGIIYNGEDSIPLNSPFQSIRVAYEAAEYPFFKWNFSPIIYYFIATLVVGIAIKPAMRVNL